MMRRGSVLLGFLFVMAHGAIAGPTIFWASDPVGPDETVVLLGDGFAENAVVEARRLEDKMTPPIANPDKAHAASTVALPPDKRLGQGPWRPLRLLQRDRQCLKCLLPADGKPGLYALRVRQGETFSEIWFINAPVPYWAQGDEGAQATPGGWLRLFGRCLAMGAAPQLLLRGPDGKTTALALQEKTCWTISGVVPLTRKPGTYTLLVHNGWGGAAGWKEAGIVTIIPRPRWKTELFPVAAPTEQALQEALEKAKANGGGIIVLPRGTIDITQPLEIPPQTVVRGAGPGMTSLYIKNTEKPPEAWISGRDFALEQLTIYCFNYRRVLSDSPASERLRLQNVRLRAVPDASRHYLMKPLVETFGALHLQGRNYQLSQCDLYCRKAGFDEARLLVFGPWGFAGSQGPYYGVIQDCLLRGHLWGSENLNGLIFERNHVEGVCPSPTTFWNNFSQHLYCAHNTIQHVYGGDREIMTFDAGGGAYFGPARAEGRRLILAAEPHFKDYAPQPHTDYRGAAVYILAGTGAGQYRFVTANEGRHWEIDRPWLVPPDETSVFSIVPFRGQSLFIGNTFLDGGAFQLYGSAADVIVAGNKGARIDGFFAWGLNPHGWGWQPAWTCQFLDNELTEPSGFGARIWGPAFFGVTTSNSNEQYAGPLARGNIFRRNRVLCDGLIKIDGRSVNTLVERCLVRHSTVGIRVGPDAAGTLLRQNRFEDVAKPYEGEGQARACVIP